MDAQEDKRRVAFMRRIYKRHRDEEEDRPLWVFLMENLYYCEQALEESDALRTESVRVATKCCRASVMMMRGMREENKAMIDRGRKIIVDMGSSSRRKSVRRKSTRRKSTRRKSTRRKSVRRKSVRRKKSVTQLRAACKAYGMVFDPKTKRCRKRKTTRRRK